MDYTIRVPSIYGDVVPLSSVAEAMARARATAFGKAPLNPSAYANLINLYTQQLLRAVADRHIKVCDCFGLEHDPHEFAQKAELSGLQVFRYKKEPDFQQLKDQYPDAYVGKGEWNFSKVGIELGPLEPDIEGTLSSAFHFKLFHLNEWGHHSGDSFCIDSNDMEWIDERGVMPPKPKSSSQQADEPRIDFRLLATPEQLVHAFGRHTGMQIAWFKKWTDYPVLKNANKIIGQSGRGRTTEPLFCPYMVMQGLIKKPRMGSSRKAFLEPETPWKLLKREFPAVYDMYKGFGPLDD